MNGSIDRWRATLLTAGGLGRSPVAPGTAGSIAPVAVALGLVLLGAGRGVVDLVMIVLALLASIACVALGRDAERAWGKDPGRVVADEVAGQAIALLFLPWRSMTEPQALSFNLLLAGAAFLLFRMLDVIKPPPIGSLQRLPRGWGILADDLAAGVVAWSLLVIGSRLFG